MFLLLQAVTTAPTVSTAEMWSAIAALAVPFIVAMIVAEHWSSTAKFIAFAVVACVVAFVTTWLTGTLSRHDLLRSALIVIGAAQLAYHSFKPAVNEVQNATSIGGLSVSRAPSTPAPPTVPPPA